LISLLDLFAIFIVSVKQLTVIFLSL